MRQNEPVGWMPSPNSRGTVSIIYSCATVIATATWTLLHLNIPTSKDSMVQALLRKARWGLFAILAPNSLSLMAANEWISAHDSVKQMLDLDGGSSWTPVHAFYANSGGFVLQPPGEPTIPINAHQLHFLVSRRYIPSPRITRDEIWDKSKSDWFAKGFVLLQAGWVVIQTIARVADGLSMSPLEIFTLSFISSTMLTSFFWWNKPQDVRVPTVLHCEFSTTKILAESDISPDVACTNSPQVFVRDENSAFERGPGLEEFALKPKIETNTCDKTRQQQLPNDPIVTTRFPSNVLAAVGTASLLHSTVHLLGWNFTYPTRIEQSLWRISAVTLASLSVIGIATIHMLYLSGQQDRQSIAWIWIRYQRAGQHRARISDILDLFLVLLFLCYAIARLYIVTEAIISLRDLPADVFVTVSWTNFIPHV